MWPRMGSQNKAHDWVNKKRRASQLPLWPSSRSRGRCMTASGEGHCILFPVAATPISCDPLCCLTTSSRILDGSYQPGISHRLRPAPWRHMSPGTYDPFTPEIVRGLDLGSACCLGLWQPQCFLSSRVLTTYSSDVCFQSHSLSLAAQLSQWSWISGHIFPLVPGQDYTLKILASRGG